MTEKLNFVRNFNPTNLEILHDKGRTIVAAFDGELQGRKLFNIRELYEEYGEWKPGKGVSVPLDKKGALLEALQFYAATHLKQKPKAA
jgi:hypothetical protein